MTEDVMIGLVEEYKKKEDRESESKTLAREKAIGALGEFLYLHLHRFRLDYVTEDTRSDFIVSLYPRFGAIIDQYDSSRASFGTYIRSIVRLSYRTFTRARYGYEARQKVYEMEEVTRLLSTDPERVPEEKRHREVCDAQVAYVLSKTLKKSLAMSKKKQEIHGRKIFLLACKAGIDLDDSLIKKLADSSGFTVEYLRTNLDRIREKCLKKSEQLQYISEKQNSFYIRCQRCLYEMKYLDKDSSRYLALEKEYRYCRKRWTAIREQAAKQIRAPSNRYLSSALGISRGTIDTTLATLPKGGYSRIS